MNQLDHIYMRNCIIYLICIFSSLNSYAQQIRASNSTHIYKEIEILQKLPRVLYIAAHPDDENTGLLSWLVNEQHIKTGYLSLTRGDGGQNLLGSEQGAALGLIRTHELLEARKIDGAEQYFSRAVDFGFSKNPEDTFKQWNIDTIVSDVVWMIRKFRPDVIICRFPPTSAAGHGQHAASAIIAEKAFKAAGDKNYFSNQLKEVAVWQPTRVLWNTYSFGSINTTNNNQFKITTGQYDPLLGMGYGELAGVSRSLHKSQGAGTRSVPGIRTEYFTLVAGEPIQNSLFDGIHQSWKNIGREDIDQSISSIINTFDFFRPDLSLPALLQTRVLFQTIDDLNLKKEKLSALDDIILQCAGLMAEMVTNKPEATAGEQLNFDLNLIARSETPVKVREIKWLTSKETVERTLSNDSLITFSHLVQIPENTKLSEPYWLATPAKTPSLYNVNDPTQIGLPIQPSKLNIALSIQIGNVPFEVLVPLSYKELDPVKGDVIEALRIVPAVAIRFTQPLFFAKGQSSLQAAISLHTNKVISNGTLNVKSNGQPITEIRNIGLGKDTDTTIHFTLPLDKINQLSTSQLDAEFSVQQNVYAKEQHLIQYSHLPVLQYFTPASAQIVKGDISVKANKIGYIEGAGDLIPNFLRLAGLQVTVLKESDFADVAKLSGYDAIVMGVRAVNVEKRMHNWMKILFKYVQNGGTLIMQYNKSQGLYTDDLGPYPFSLSSSRVTEENAQVTFLNPSHRLLNFPNKISTADFQNWVQEMGTYFPSNWDEHYEPLFEMHDTGEQKLNGATLYAKYGRGNYIYTSLSFFRQLPIGNIGATKLFFNMLSAGK